MLDLPTLLRTRSGSALPLMCALLACNGHKTHRRSDGEGFSSLPECFVLSGSLDQFGFLDRSTCHSLS